MWMSKDFKKKLKGSNPLKFKNTLKVKLRWKMKLKNGHENKKLSTFRHKTATIFMDSNPNFSNVLKILLLTV